MSRQYVSTEFDCRRISVIVHRSVSDKLAADSLVLLVCGLSLIPPKREKECLTIVSNQRLVNDKLFQVFRHTQLYTPYNFIRS